MANKDQKDYPSLDNLNEEDLDENSSLTQMLALIGKDKTVIDFGCATGYFCKFLKARGCKVTGVDINENAVQSAKQYCENVIVADLDITPLSEILENNYFDVAVFGDVLEHIKNPWSVLQQVHYLLKEDGYVVASIPNIAHGAVRLALLQGKFEYANFGILDSTHLRFFTKDTVNQLFEDSGYAVTSISRTKLDFLSGSPLIPQINPTDFSPDLLEEVQRDKECNTLQFVVLANQESSNIIPIYRKSRQLEEELEKTTIELERIEKSLNEAQTELHSTKVTLHETQIELHSTKVTLHEAQTELHPTKVTLHEAQTELHSTKVTLHEAQTELYSTKVTLHEAQTELHSTKVTLHEAQINLHSTKIELHEAQTELHSTKIELYEVGQREEEQKASSREMHALINVMESSKFWKLRNTWFKYKSMLGRKV
jgi:O-antigen biosynthesis protein